MNFPVKQVSQRYVFVATLLVLCGIAILARAVYIMTVKKDYWLAVSERLVKENDVVPPTRGNILASGGEVLAASLPEYKLFMDYMSWEKDVKRRGKEQHLRDSLLKVKADSITQGMCAIFPDIDSIAFRTNLLEGRKQKSHHWPLYKKRVTYIQYRQCKALPIFNLSANKGGFHTETFPTRKNPYGRLAIRTIGDLYKGKDSARTGLELSFDSILRGKPGIAHRQKVLNRYLSIIDKPAEDGCDVLTTLDVSMQDICEKALSDKLTEIEANSGVCILMEVQTGDIKAMTSLRRMEDGTYQEVNADAVKNLYEPGSVFKPMSFLVGMDDGFIKMTDQVDVGCGIKEMYGRKMRDANWRSGGSGVVTVPQILQKSLNVGVSTLIDRYYHNNPRKFVEGIYRIGVNEDLKIPIPGYAKPRIRMPNEDGSNWSKTALPWMSIGYETQIPPITTINFYNGIANGGKLLRPRLVKAILRGGEVVKEYPVEVLREQMAKPEAVKNIQDCLESVVSVGLGKKAGSKYFKVSGKTGTAQIWTKNGFASQYLVSFAGYFPSDRPKYSCIVCIQKGAPASGGGMCAPVFKRVAETVMAQNRVSDYSSARDTFGVLVPVVSAGNLRSTSSVLEQLGINFTSDADAERPGVLWCTTRTDNTGVALTGNASAADNVVPDVTGYGLRDAVYRLEKMGLRVKASGAGRVSWQNLQPGYKFKRGEEIELILGDKEDIPQAERPDTVKKDTTVTVKNPDEPEDSELTPTKKDEEKLKKAEQQRKEQLEKEKKNKKEEQKADKKDKKAVLTDKKKETEKEKKSEKDKKTTEKPKAAATEKKTAADKTKKASDTGKKSSTSAKKTSETNKKTSDASKKAADAHKKSDTKSATTTTKENNTKKKSDVSKTKTKTATGNSAKSATSSSKKS